MLNKLIEWAVSFWTQAIELITWCFDTLISLLIDVFYYLFHGVLFGIENLFNGISFSQIQALKTLQSWTGLPSQVIWLLNALNIPTCLGFIIACYVIRFSLNLIPSVFTRV